MFRSFLALCVLCSLFHGGTALAFTLFSSAFKSGEFTPPKYTCQGTDFSPPLQWSDSPKNTQSFALILDDPDAPNGVWDHWILFNIPANVNQLAENLKKLPSGTLEGKNSWGNVDYRGPCPPAQQEHRYFFKLYALDSTLSLPAAVTKSQLESAMKNHVLGHTELMTKYKR
jgi:Raf kinase inhibitor-like YbhB/YbcL family protein